MLLPQAWQVWQDWLTHVLLQAQKRHLKQPTDANVLVEDGNVYVVPKM